MFFWVLQESFNFAVVAQNNSKFYKKPISDLHSLNDYIISNMILIIQRDASKHEKNN